MTTASQLFANAEAVLLDFDGPVASVFANVDPRQASRAVVEILRARGCDVGKDWASQENPHALLVALQGKVPGEALLAADIAVSDVERIAVTNADPTPGIGAVLDAIGDRGWAIVSNNGAEAIQGFLQRFPWATPNAVFGRPVGRPHLMKPNPHLVFEAVHRLETSPGAAVFLGDSVSDVDAGRRAGVPVIGYANKPGKAETLQSAGAAAVITTMAELALPCS